MNAPHRPSRLGRVGLLCLLVGLAVPSASGQEMDADLPSWTLYEKGADLLPSPDDALVLAGENDPGEALRFFRRAIARREQELQERGIDIDTEASLFPEAEAGLARVYAIEGNLTLAERHYLRALDASAFLAIPETELEIRYDLASLYEMSGQRLPAQQQWLAIVREVDDFESDDTRELLDNYQRIFREDGFNRLMQLYRQGNVASLEAHQRLGQQFLGMGRYEAAFDHEIVSMVKTVSVVVEEIRVFRPLYEFEALADVLALAREYPHILSFLEESGFYPSLERLAQASFRLRGANSQSAELWRLVANYGPRGSAATLKARQRMVTPATDPLIVPR